MGKNDPYGAYNRSLIFKGKNQVYLKDNMDVHLMSVDKMLWVTIEDEHFVPKSIINDT